MLGLGDTLGGILLVLGIMLNYESTDAEEIFNALEEVGNGIDKNAGGVIAGFGVVVIGSV